MSIKNIIGFGKDSNNEAQIIGISGEKNNNLKTMSLEMRDKYFIILKELKKLNLYLSVLTDNYVRNQDIGD